MRARSSRAAAIASSVPRASRSASARSVSAAARLSLASLRPSSALSISPISARRLTRNRSGASASVCLLGAGFGHARLEFGDLRARPAGALVPGLALGDERLAAARPDVGFARHAPARRRALRRPRRARGRRRCGRARAGRRAGPGRRAPVSASSASPVFSLGFVAARCEAGRRFLERRDAGDDLAAPSLGSSRILARFFETTGGGAQRLAGVLFGRGGGGSMACARSASARRTSAARRAASASRVRSPSRFFSARRRAAGVGASAAAIKPSQRHRSPCFETRRWPTFSSFCKCAPSLRSTRPIWASRRASAGGAVTHLPRGSTPGGKAGSSAPSPLTDQWAGRRNIGRGIEIIAERRAERGFIAFGDGNLLDDRRPEVARRRIEEFGQRAHFRLQALGRALGLGMRRTATTFLLARLGVAGLGGERIFFRGLDRRLGQFERLGERENLVVAAGARLQRRALFRHFGEFGAEAAEAPRRLRRAPLRGPSAAHSCRKGPLGRRRAFSPPRRACLRHRQTFPSPNIRFPPRLRSAHRSLRPRCRAGRERPPHPR